MSQPSQLINPPPLILHRCRFGRSDLDKLFETATEGMPNPRITVSTQRDGVRFTYPCLADLVDAVDRAASSGEWTNLEWLAEDADSQKVRISITMDRTEVEIAGENAIWVLGQRQQLQNILTKRGYLAGSKPPSWSLRAVASGVILDALVIALSSQSDDSALRFVGRLGFVLIMVGGLNHWATRKSRRALLLVSQDLPTGSWWSNLGNADRIATVSAAAAIVGVVVAIFQVGG